MNDDYIQITCPGCATILIVQRRTGKIVETRKPILEQGSGDRFEDAMQKVRQSQSEIERKVREAREREKSKQDRLESLFKDGLKRASEQGPISKPEREMDLD